MKQQQRINVNSLNGVSDITTVCDYPSMHHCTNVT